MTEDVGAPPSRYLAYLDRLEQSMAADAHLISKGVRLLCWETLSIGEEGTADTVARLEKVARRYEVLPFSLQFEESGGEYLAYGFAKYTWAIDLVIWVKQYTQGLRQVALFGLLLGHGSLEIETHLERLRRAGLR